MFCYVFCQKFWLIMGLHNSCSISIRAGGTCQKCITKHHDWTDVKHCRANLLRMCARKVVANVSKGANQTTKDVFLLLTFPFHSSAPSLASQNRDLVLIAVLRANNRYACTFVTFPHHHYSSICQDLGHFPQLNPSINSPLCCGTRQYCQRVSGPNALGRWDDPLVPIIPFHEWVGLLTA